MAEAAFSEDGKYYSALTQDGRLRIWDTETNVLKQEYTPDLHLATPPTCLQWISVTSTTSPQKGARRKSVSEQETQCIALGTSNGKILLYSISQAKVESVLTDQKKKNKIQTLDWHRKYGLFSCTNDNSVQEWDLQSSTVRNKYNIHVASNNKQENKVGAIRIVPHNQNTPAKYIIVASSQVRLWRLYDNDATIIKCLGHNAAPRALLTVAQINKACWLIEGSQTERLLSFWDVTITEEHLPQTNGEDVPSKRQRKKSISTPLIPTPTYNFVLEDAPRIIDVELKTEDGATKLNLAAATRSGVVHYYGHMLNGASTKPIKPSVTIQVTTEDAQPLPLQCCKLPTTGDLLLGYNNGPTLLFEKITPDLKTKTQVIIRGESKQKSKVNQTNEVNKVRSEKGNAVTYVEPMGGVSRKRPTVGGKVEVSMEARLANLTVDVKSQSKSAVNLNMTKLLMQGLRSNDKGMLLSVLQRDEIDLANRTTAALPPDHIPLLLQQLADLASRRTVQCSAACTWLSAVLKCHSALLLATLNSKTSDHLTQLLAIFTQRRSHLCQLLNLKGRLDLTISQRSTNDEIVEQQPVLEYNDTSSDEEMEVERYQSESEQSWGDENDSQASHSDQSDD